VKRTVAFGAAGLLTTLSAGASAEPDPAIAVFAGGALEVSGMALGAALLGGANGDPTASRIGWLTIHAAYTLAPGASHAIVGEWGRGAFFSAVPAACLVVTGAVLDESPDAVQGSPLGRQRALWLLFTAGLASSLVGILDVGFAGSRKVTVVPSFGPTGSAVSVGGRF
jgi:hypothetical protein